MSEDEPKIIVDDDWKSQVEREKEQLAKEEAEKAAQPDAPEGSHPLPPASFPILVSTLSTQALATLGYIPDPATGEASVNRGMAKHFIDTLGVLEEKTKGNLTPDEESLLTETLHQLRMAFVDSKNRQAGSEGPDQPEKPSSIELP